MGVTNSREIEDGSFNPSWLTIQLGTSSKSKYKHSGVSKKYSGEKPILVICTDDGKMKMKNGKVFNTGNHPVEMFVPMLHMKDVGFNFDIATSTGKPVVLEMWAFPTKDDKVTKLHEEIKSMMNAPKQISDIANLDDYSAIFIPGGHGAMINLPDNADLGRLLHEAHEKDILTITLCHGPAALLSTGKVDGKEFAYKGYEAVCFTDITDAKTPGVGYLPGHMPWKCQEALENKGIKIKNKKETGQVMQSKELITGDSPYAAQNLGVCAAKALVEKLVK